MSYRRVHKLKCWESLFLDVRAGRKRAEFRRNDRDFVVGDMVILMRWRPDECEGRGAYISALGSLGYGENIDCIRVVITHIAEGRFGIPDGFCMFSFRFEGQLAVEQSP